MTAMVLDRTTPIEALFSFIGASRVRVEREAERTVLTPIIDPADYDNDTDYLNAIPGMREKILEGLNTPLSECIPLEEVWSDV